jgi:ubiquinone/menaquinone biosynthesis C-methylase UbiE
MSQKDIFLKSEGNKWFERNKESIISAEDDFPIKIMEMYNIQPKKILEIGCSNGFRLNRLKERFNCECCGVEPSKKAIEDGKTRYQKIKLVQGICSDIPLDEKFDIIIVNFVLHWVDREDLFKCVNEINRLLKKEGHLVIGDFFPDKPITNKYHHLPNEDVMTFKQDYASLFISLKNYIHIAHLSTSHESMRKLKSEKESDERISVSLLFKK